MTLPLTFSSSGESYEPSIEDALREGVYLMLLADTVNRKGYSYDDDSPASGVRISSRVAHVNLSDGRITVPQQVVSIAISDNRWTAATSEDGEKRVSIAIAHLEAPETADLDIDVTAPMITPETRLARTESVLMRGTIYKPDLDSFRARVIDPYRTPLYTEEDAPSEDLIGAYDEGKLRILNALAPEIRRTNPFPIRRRMTNDEAFAVDPRKDIAVAYSLIATYTIKITDREDMTHGGFANG